MESVWSLMRPSRHETQTGHATGFRAPKFLAVDDTGLLLECLVAILKNTLVLGAAYRGTIESLFVERRLFGPDLIAASTSGSAATANGDVFRL